MSHTDRRTWHRWPFWMAICNIGQLFSNNYQLMNMIRGIQAPDYTSKECSGCEKKYFCSYCIIRGLVAAKEKGFENCAWYSQYIPNEFRRLLI